MKLECSIMGFMAMMILASPLKAEPAIDIDSNSHYNERRAHAAGHQTTHKGSYHVYVGTTLLGDQIGLEDGSYWMTKPDDRHKLLKWEPGHNLMIMQNWCFFCSKSNFPYIIYNEQTWDTMEVENSAPPEWENFYYLYIAEIDKPAVGQGTLKLNDGTVWVLPDTKKDRAVWSQWQLNHNIIIGSNSSIWRFFTPNILINVSFFDQYVPSNCVN